MNKYMKECIEISKKWVQNNEGGPFGACIGDKNNNIISISNNTVLKDNDPTAHAEVNAIRMACKKINSYDLSDFVLYTNCEPCPMCLSAIIWANIKEVYYANTKKDAAEIGFRDDMIYEYLKDNNKNVIEKRHIESKDALEVLKKFKELEDKIMY